MNLSEARNILVNEIFFSPVRVQTRLTASSKKHTSVGWSPLIALEPCGVPLATASGFAGMLNP